MHTQPQTRFYRAHSFPKDAATGLYIIYLQPKKYSGFVIEKYNTNSGTTAQHLDSQINNPVQFTLLRRNISATLTKSY